jgi:uncharacterized membrane protein
MGDWRTQVVLGGFLGIFAYCIVVLRSIRGEGNNQFVPSVSVLGSILLSFLAIALIIYFIHHIATSIRASNIIRSVYDETISAIDDVYPLKGERDSNPSGSRVQDVSWFALVSRESGYLQAIETEKLAALARKHGLIVRVEKAPGEFVAEGAHFISVSKSVTVDVEKDLWRLIRMGTNRTFEQDVSFGIRQLVDIALKGLSPGINDVTTAAIAIDFLGAILGKLCNHELENEITFDHDRPLVISKCLTFPEILSLSFDQIRRNGASDPAVLARVADALGMIAQRAVDALQIRAVETQLDLLRSTLETEVPDYDRTMLSNRILELKKECRINERSLKVRVPSSDVSFHETPEVHV